MYNCYSVFCVFLKVPVRIPNKSKAIYRHFTVLIVVFKALWNFFRVFWDRQKKYKNKKIKIKKKKKLKKSKKEGIVIENPLKKGTGVKIWNILSQSLLNIN